MKNLLLIGTVLMFGLNVYAIDKGNGGGIHFCKGQKTQELYDIYEAQARYGLEVIKSTRPANELVELAVKKITGQNEYIGRLVNEQIKYIKNGHFILRSKMNLVPIDDATILVTDEGCSYKQLANWDEVSGNLLVSKDYFTQLNSVNQAALYIHEALYKVGRDLKLLAMNEKNRVVSDEVRRIVGEVFSTNSSMPSLWDIVDPQIEIDRQEAVISAVRTKLENLKSECVRAETEYENFVSAMNTRDISQVAPYMKFYFEKISVCINSSASIRHEMAIPDFSLDAYREVSLSLEKMDSYNAVETILFEMRKKHERVMTDIQKI